MGRIDKNGETNSSAYEAMTYHSRDHKQEALSSFSSIKIGVGFKDE